MRCSWLPKGALSLAVSLTIIGCKSEASGPEGIAAPRPDDATRAGSEREDARPEGEFPPGPYADRDPALAQRLVESGALLLDVRTPEEFAAGHIEGAVNISHSELPGRLDEIRELQGGDPHKPVVLYCRSGRRADISKSDLEGAGFDRVTNLGGLTDWPSP